MKERKKGGRERACVRVPVGENMRDKRVRVSGDQKQHALVPSGLSIQLHCTACCKMKFHCAIHTRPCCTARGGVLCSCVWTLRRDAASAGQTDSAHAGDGNKTTRSFPRGLDRKVISNQALYNIYIHCSANQREKYSNGERRMDMIECMQY